MKRTLILCQLLIYYSFAYGQTTFLNPFRSGDPGTESWSNFAPSNTYYNGTSEPYGIEAQGRVNAVWVNPTDSNTILVGTDAGGLWKSINGGNTWHNLTDVGVTGTSKILGMMGVNWIAVNPLDTNIIYLAIHMYSQYEKSTEYGLGLVFTTDGGNHWYADTGFANAINTEEYAGAGYTAQVTKIGYAPGTQKLYAIWGQYALYKQDSSTGWTDITSMDWYSTTGNNACLDLGFSSTMPGKAIVSTQSFSNTGHLYVYSPDTSYYDPWTDVSFVLPSPYTLPDAWGGPIQFSMGSGDTAYIRLNALDGSRGVALIMKTSIHAVNLQMCDTAFPGTMSQFAVSQANPGVLYAVNVDGTDNDAFCQSTDNGGSFPYFGYDHADGRCLYIYHSDADPYNDVVYFGTDGGLRKKGSHQNYSLNITGTGLDITEFYGIGNTESDEDVAIGGAQDQGAFAYTKTAGNPWSYNEVDGDGENAKMERDNMTHPYVESDGPLLYESTLYSTGILDDTPISHPIDSSQPANRPLYFDKNDACYVGYDHIWKQASGTTTWFKAFPNGDPIDYSSGHYYKKNTIDFYINENDNDSAYVAYKDASGPGTRPDTSNVIGKLFVSFNSQSTNPLLPPIWANITPGIVDSYAINTIAVDPNNSSRIWVGFGNMMAANVGTLPPASMTERVWYSADAGATWTDVSAGLPSFSVNKLLYRKGSTDEIYAGTDAGVYMWNPGSSSWVSFNSGLPPCVVMDMEFNYCAQKMRIATYGRGMWETSMPYIAAPKPTVISSSVLAANAPGNNNIYLQSSIDVQAGATLGIYDDTVHMPAGAIISVEPGGKLIISHAMITNDCDGKFWHGIQARGICGDPQWAVDQGTVIIENGSTIANALVGVANSDETVAWSTDGGIIQCGNSYFVDNQVSASFREYDNFTGEPLHPVLHPNVSYFTNCTFLIDNNYKGNTTGNSFQYMVNMKSVEGITFSGCQFLNRDTVAFRGLGEGIHAVNTGFNVVATCSPPSSPSSMETCMDEIRSRFCGFSKGIDIGGLWQMPLSVAIDRTDFDSVSVGEFVAAFNDVSTTNCNFNVGHGLRLYTAASSPVTSCNQNVGIFNQNSLRFRIEANTFQGFPNHATTDWYNIGTAIANTGDTATNKVYRNSFDSLNAAVFAAGVNNDGSPVDDRGLKILCNTFSNSVNDIVIANDGSSSTGQGIALNQGLPSGPPAGNTFYRSTNNIVNDVQHINYYYDGASSSTEEPTVVTPIYVLVHSETAAKSCPSTLGDATSSPDGARTLAPISAVDYSSLAPMKLSWYNNNTRLINVLSVYNGLIDFGNTTSLEAAIAGSTDTTGLYKTLKGGSPYISEAALRTVADDAALPYYSMMKIMKMNPDDLRDNNFIAYMNGDYSFTTADMDTLLLYANNTTSRTVLEDSIALAQDTMDAMTNLIMMALKTPIDTNVSVNDTTGAGICLDTTSVYYGLDSNSIYLGLDSIDAWLKNIGNVWSRYERVGYYSFMGDNTTAASIFTAMGSEIPSISPDRTVYNTYANIEDVLFTGGTDSGKIYTLDSAQIAALDVTGQPGFTYNSASVVGFNISLAGRTGGGAVGPYPESLAIPCAAYMIVTDFPADRHGNGSTPQSPPPIININAANGNKQFSAYPNPTSGIVTFAYNIQDGSNGITIAITNIVGENVATIQTANNNGSANWDPRTLSPGVYIYQASDVKGIISKGKIVVEK